jgi:hypothetical protein
LISQLETMRSEFPMGRKQASSKNSPSQSNLRMTIKYNEEKCLNPIFISLFTLILFAFFHFRNEFFNYPRVPPRAQKTFNNIVFTSERERKEKHCKHCKALRLRRQSNESRETLKAFKDFEPRLLFA